MIVDLAIYQSVLFLNGITTSIRHAPSGDNIDAPT